MVSFYGTRTKVTLQLTETCKTKSSGGLDVWSCNGPHFIPTLIIAVLLTSGIYTHCMTKGWV